jgi:hypothetical protein
MIKPFHHAKEAVTIGEARLEMFHRLASLNYRWMQAHQRGHLETANAWLQAIQQTEAWYSERELAAINYTRIAHQS